MCLLPRFSAGEQILMCLLPRFSAGKQIIMWFLPRYSAGEQIIMCLLPRFLVNESIIMFQILKFQFEKSYTKKLHLPIHICNQTKMKMFCFSNIFPCEKIKMFHWFICIDN
jgi:hypothetical protein